MLRRTVAAEKFRALRRGRSLFSVEIGEGDAAAKFARPRAAHHDRARLRIDFSDQVRRGRFAGAAENAFCVGRYRKAARAPGFVLQSEAENFDRLVGRHELQKIADDAARGVLETAV